MTDFGKCIIFGVALSSFLVLSCSSESITPPVFNAKRSFTYLTDQVDFGPRVPGTEASARCRTYFYQFFDSLGIPVDSQVFDYFDPYSQTEFSMVNVIGSYKSPSNADTDKILLMAHYDCRPRADFASTPELQLKPIDGANDGASGVAVLMEIANHLAMIDPGLDVDIVFVDGEDWGQSGDINNYLLGSKEFARRGIRNKYIFGIVVDLVGDADLNIYRERYSEENAKPLNDLIFETAAKLSAAGFIDTVKYAIQDDHLPLIAAGVPAINIIDFDYAYWHTEEDTPDKCSPQSLESVGKVLLEVIYRKTLWQKIK